MTAPTRESWIAIRVSGALAILGSALTLLLAGVLAWMALYASPPAGGNTLMKPMMAVLAAFFTGLTAWGVATGAGIFRRRGWARASIIIFAVLLVGMGGSALLGILFIRLPESPELSGRTMLGIRVVMAAFYGSLALIGAWWLLLFNSNRARQYFAEGAAPPGDGRPLSIRIIGWYLLLCAVGTAVAGALRVPAVLFGAVVTGWATLGIYTAFTAVEIYLGTGLLQFQKAARLGSIAFFALVAASAAVSLALPGFAGRMQSMEDAMPRFLRAPQAAMPFDSIWPFAWTTVLVAAVPIWFLLRRREAFQ